MTTATQSANRVSKIEVAVLGMILIGGFSLLLPALPASREAARANLCRRNLRWLDLATRYYVDHQRRLPHAITWPVDLLPRLQEQIGRDKHRPGMDIFTMERPMFLTCPSRPQVAPGDSTASMSHYELVMDRDKRARWDRVTWKYRDRPFEVPQDARKAWYMGVEIPNAVAEEQLRSFDGPHANGTFYESDSQGNTFARQRIH